MLFCAAASSRAALRSATVGRVWITGRVVTVRALCAAGASGATGFTLEESSVLAASAVGVGGVSAGLV